MSDASLISAVVIAIVAYVYFTIIRPARAEQSTHRQQMRDLRPGDEVLTTANFVGKIKDIQIGTDGQTRISIEIADGVVVTAFPNAIYRRLTPKPESSGEASKGASA